jgi:non-canonical purine NTP pyrophosphatase (RdgB/HAM1 family)
MDILFATGNPHKVAQVAAVLNRPVIQIEVELPEIQAVDVREVIEEKTKAAYRIVGKPVLVEDTSLSFHAWNGLPGALIKWFLTRVGNDGICNMLSAFADKRAVAETYLGYFDGDKVFLFAAHVEGEIVPHPRGSNGFGWDPIFQPTGFGKTFAELTLEQADSVNMRKLAALKLKDYLDAHQL